MADFTITLTDDQIEALESLWEKDILDNITIEQNVSKLADNYIIQRVEEEERALTIDQRKSNLGSGFSIKK